MWTVCVLLVTCEVSAQNADEQVAPAQVDPPDQVAQSLDVNDDGSSLRVQVKALAMFPAPGGRISFPGTSRVGEYIDVEAINLDSPRLSPVEAAIRAAEGEWWSLCAGDGQIEALLASMEGWAGVWKDGLTRTPVGSPVRASVGV